MFTTISNSTVTVHIKMSLCFAVLTVLLGICCSTSFGSVSPESRANTTTSLVRGLMKHYEASTEPFLLPLQRNLGPVEVNISWFPTNILNFHESNQYIELRGYISLSWHDLNLKWTANDTGIYDVDIPGEKIWTPQLVLYESQSYDYTSVFYENRMTSVNHNGIIVWKSDVTTSTFCQVFQETFPCDRQACKLTFTSAMRYQTLIKFFGLNLSTNRHSMIVANGAWEVKRVMIPDCLEMEKLRNRTAIRFVVELKRRLQRYYVVTLVVPCFILSLFTSLVFLLPTDSDKRMDLAMMNVLTLFVYQGLIDSIGPPTGSSYLSTFVLITIFEATATTVLEILKQQVKKNYPPDDKPVTMKKTGKSIVPCLIKEKTKETTKSAENIQEEPKTPGEPDTLHELRTHNETSNQGKSSNLSDSGPGDPSNSSKSSEPGEPSTTNLSSEPIKSNNVMQNIVASRMFDQIIGRILFTFKCTVFIIFGFLFILAENNPSDIIKCRNEYYFDE